MMEQALRNSALRLWLFGLVGGVLASCRPAAGPPPSVSGAIDGGGEGLLPARGAPVPTGPQLTANQRVDSLAEELLAIEVQAQPVFGTWLGAHAGDDRLDDVRLDIQAQRAARLRALVERLRQIPDGELDAVHRIDRQLLGERIAVELFELVELRPLERSPLFYAELVAQGLDELLAHDAEPLVDQLRPLTARLWKVRPLLDEARRNLRPTTSELQTRRASELLQTTQSFIAEVLPKLVAPIAEGKQLDDFRAASADAARALDDFAGWLQRELAPRVRGELSLGRERYLQKLMIHTGIESPPEQLLFLADAELREAKRHLDEATRALQGTRAAADVPRLLEEDHPKADELMTFADAMLQQLVVDLRQKDLLLLSDAEKPALVEMPPERWGLVQPRVSGLLESRPRPPVLLLDPVDKRWPDKRKIEHLRALHRGALWLALADGVARIVLQERSRRAPTTSQKLRQAPTLVAGWSPFLVQRLVALMPPSEARLRWVEARQSMIWSVRLIAALRFHALGQRLDDIVRLFSDELGLDEYQARREAERVALDALSGVETLGRVELELVLKDLRRENPSLSTAQLIDRMLAHGTPTVATLRKLLGLAGG